MDYVEFLSLHWVSRCNTARLTETLNYLPSAKCDL